MRVGDFKNYIFDEVVLYRENPKVDGEYIDIHKGFIFYFTNFNIEFGSKNNRSENKRRC